MKLAAYFTSTLFTSLTLLAILFKLMHWPGANPGFVFGFGGLALFAVPLMAIYKYKNN